MNKLLFFLLLIGQSAFAQDSVTEIPVTSADTPVMTTELFQEEHVYKPRKSHWLTSFGFEGTKYEVPIEFAGQNKNITPEDRELWGGRLGFGRELYLGLGFNATTKIEGYYTGTLFTKREKLDEDQDVESAYIRRSGNLWGVDLTQSLGFMFNMKTKNPFLGEWAYLTVEPFVEAGIGRAWAYNKIDYHYDLNGINEDYRKKISDEIINTRFGGGINFTSITGYFLYLKAFLNDYVVDKRKTKSYQKFTNGSASITNQSLNDVNVDPFWTYAVGGGYKF